MIRITENDVQRLLPMEEAVRLLRQAFLDLRNGKAGNQVRRRLHTPDGTVLHSMAGWQGKYLGTKVYTTNVRHGAWFWFHLYEQETGKPLALMEANFLGQIRTGAASGLATDLLAKPDAKSLAILGSGFQAQAQLDAMRVVRPGLEEIRVWSRSAEKREAFASANDIHACSTAEEAVREADIICTATFAKDPVLEKDWVKPGAHINAMGSNNSERRELPSELIEAAKVIVADSKEACQVEAGDLLLCQGLDWRQVRELKDENPGWKPGNISIFKSVGLGLEDVAAGAFVYEKKLLLNGH